MEVEVEDFEKTQELLPLLYRDASIYVETEKGQQFYFSYVPNLQSQTGEDFDILNDKASIITPVNYYEDEISFEMFVQNHFIDNLCLTEMSQELIDLIKATKINRDIEKCNNHFKEFLAKLREAPNPENEIEELVKTIPEEKPKGMYELFFTNLQKE